jgi:hypothetical protein
MGGLSEKSATQFKKKNYPCVSTVDANEIFIRQTVTLLAVALNLYIFIF